MNLYRQLKKKLDKQILSDRLLKRHANSRDASFYRLLPQVIVTPRHEEDVHSLLSAARELKAPIVFRAAGTNLSGQAITDSILVRVDQHWRDYEIQDGGELISLQPGVVGSWANMYLAPFQRKIGPDPGSITAALIGGIVANNASGISSGIEYDSYHTLESIRCILPSGFVFDSADPEIESKLKYSEHKLYKTLVLIRDEIRADQALSQQIRQKYSIKNTMGYTLNSFLDFDRPSDILAHLMVGSEGTLGFIANVTLKTRKVSEHKTTSLLMFPDLEAAVEQVPALKALEPSALELLDESALLAIKDVPGIPSNLQGSIPSGCAAILIEFEADSVRSLRSRSRAATSLLEKIELLEKVKFTEKQSERSTLWKVRRELGPLHAANRRGGSIVVSEDVCFQLEDLAEGTRELQKLLNSFQYDDAIIFGHAGDGNLHFKLTIDFEHNGSRERYRAFMEQLSELVAVRFKGSLKAEHGTGRNMAPFMEREWGQQALAIMWRIKQVIDPDNIMNPDVIFTEDPLLHLRDIKPMPGVDESIDGCIECGLCEPFCPSHDLTLSPRERIIVLREVSKLAEGPHHEQMQAHKIQQDFRYEGVQTCARDGLCGLACPVDINTGELMKIYHSQLHSRSSRFVSMWTARQLRWISLSLRSVLKLGRVLADLFDEDWVTRVSRIIQKASFGLIPSWSGYFPGPAKPLPARDTESPDLIYFPSCLSRTLAGSNEDDSVDLPAVFHKILDQAGLKAAYPEEVKDLCCGLAFHSKSFTDAATQSATRVVESLWRKTDEGRIPVVMDTTPCSRFMRDYNKLLSGVTAAKWRQIQLLDIIEYLHDSVLPELKLEKLKGDAVLHPTCSAQELALDDKMRSIASSCAESVVIPQHLGCCGFAGDRGLRVPELTDSASALEGAEVSGYEGEAGFYSTSRTCEVGMSQASGREYRSILYLVEKAMVTEENSA